MVLIGASLALVILAVATVLVLCPPARRAAYGVLFSGRAPAPDLAACEDWPTRLATVSGTGSLTQLDERLTILSYNIRRAERLSRAAASLLRATDRYQPELILLQEAPLEFIHSPRLTELLEGRTLLWAPFHTVQRPTRRYPYPAYGQAIISSSRPLHSQVIVLPTVNASTLGAGHRMQRIALYCELPVGDTRTLGLANTHIEPFARGIHRLRQYEAVLAACHRRAPEVCLVCGDFNPTLGQHREPGIRLLERLGFENAFRHRWRILDNCFARGHLSIELAEELHLPGSDHHPIVVRLMLQAMTMSTR